MHPRQDPWLKDKAELPYFIVVDDDEGYSAFIETHGVLPPMVPTLVTSPPESPNTAGDAPVVVNENEEQLNANKRKHIDLEILPVDGERPEKKKRCLEFAKVLEEPPTKTSSSIVPKSILRMEAEAPARPPKLVVNQKKFTLNPNAKKLFEPSEVVSKDLYVNPDARLLLNNLGSETELEDIIEFLRRFGRPDPETFEAPDCIRWVRLFDESSEGLQNFAVVEFKDEEMRNKVLEGAYKAHGLFALGNSVVISPCPALIARHVYKVQFSCALDKRKLFKETVSSSFWKTVTKTTPLCLDETEKQAKVLKGSIFFKTSAAAAAAKVKLNELKFTIE